MPKIFPFLGKTQLQVLSVIVSLLLFGGHVFTAVCIKERVLLKSSEVSSGFVGLESFCLSVLTNSVVRKSDNSKATLNMILTQIHQLWIYTLDLPRVIKHIVHSTPAHLSQHFYNFFQNAVHDQFSVCINSCLSPS